MKPFSLHTPPFQPFGWVAFTVLLTFTGRVTLAQEPTDIIKKQVAVELLGQMGSAATGSYTGSYTFDNRYEGVRGSRWLFSGWRPGRVKVTGRDSIVEVAGINVDLDAHQLLVLLDTNKSVFIQAERLASALIGDGDERIEVLSVESSCFGRDEIGHVLPISIYEGQKYTLLRLEDRRFLKADYQGAYSPNRRADEWQEESSYWLMDAEGCQKLRLNARSLSKAIPNQAARIKKLSRKDYNPKTEAGMAALLAELED